MGVAMLEETVGIPAWVSDWNSFRRWAKSDEFPERGRFAFFDDTVWVDLSMEELFGHNFVKAMVRLEAERDTLSVVNDQTGSSTWSRDLADGLLVLASSDAAAGSYHATNQGETTWYGLARAVFEELGADPERVQSTTSLEFTRPAPRPTYSVLSSRAWADAGLPRFQSWRAALTRAFRADGDAMRGRG